jgi:tetratricopeptide (TPR) repeat protein
MGARPPFDIPAAWTRFRPAIDRFDTLEARGRRAEAWAYLDSLVAAQRSAGAQQRLVQSLVKRGGTRAFRGDFTRGEPDLKEAMRLARAIGDTLGEIMSVQYIAFAAIRVGRFDEARPLYDRMLRLSVARRDLSHEGWARMGRAYMDLSNGQPQRAAQGYRRVIALMQRCGDVAGLMDARTGLANALRQLGRGSEAIEEYRRLAEEAAQRGLPIVQANALMNLSSIEPDPALAVRQLAEAERLCRETRNRGGAWGAATSRALALMNLGRYEQAAVTLNQVIVESRAAGALGEWAEARVPLAAVRFRQGRAAEAEQILRATLVAGDSLSPRAQEYVLADLASMLLASGRARDALAVIDNLRAKPWFPTTRVAGDRLRAIAAFALAAEGRPREGIARLDAPPERPDAPAHDPMFMGSRLARGACWHRLGRRDSAIALVAGVLQSWDRNRTRTNDPEWRETFGAASWRIVGRVIESTLAGDGRATPPEDARRAFELLQVVKARTLAERMDAGALRARSPEGSAPVTLARVQRLLGPGEVFLDYYVGDVASAVFVVTSRELHAVRLPDWNLVHGAVERARGLFARPGADTSATRETAAALAERVWGGNAALLAGARRVIVSADAAYQDVPFELLPIRRGGPPLLASAEVSHAPSARLFVRLRERAAGTAPRAVFALAGARNERGQRLQGAEDEVRWLARQYAGVEARTSAQVHTTAELARELAHYGLLHFAGHASRDPSRPWRAGLLVGDGLAENDWLRASEIARLKLPARLAVLSACQSTGEWSLAEGRRGLASAFLSAGVPAVVATRWAVSDQAAEAFTRELYPRLARGLPAAAAVREAQLALRSRPQTASPADWAGFLLVGEPGVRVTLRPAGLLLPKIGRR